MYPEYISIPEAADTSLRVFRDINLDGHLDFVSVARFQGGKVFVAMGNGDTTFQPRIESDVPGDHELLVCADLNNDGLLDLAIADETEACVTVLVGDGEGSFQTAQKLETSRSVQQLATGDFNADGALDLACIRRIGKLGSVSEVFVFLGNGDGTFLPERSIDMRDGGRRLATGDLNGDTYDDLVVTNLWDADTSILLSLGNGTFHELDEPIVFPTPPYRVFVTDFNTDGRQDLVLVLGNGIALLPGNGDSTFQDAIWVNPGENAFAITSLVFDDINTDGLPDVFVPRNSSSFLANGDGAYQRIVHDDGELSARTLADLNSDGVPDLVFHDEENYRVRIGNGDGTFRIQRSFNAFSNIISPAFADFELDGSPDLVHIEFSALGRLHVIFDLDSSWSPLLTSEITDLVAGEYAWALAAGDVNNDGFPDIAVANRVGDDLSVILGNGDRTFQPEQRFGVGDAPEFVALGDLNNDGADDAVTVNVFSDDISVLLSNADGTFQPQQLIPVGDLPMSVTIADLNADGAPDLVVPNRNDDDLSVLLGNGDGSFQPDSRVIAGDKPMHALALDLNNDGALDLAVSNQNSDDVSVLLGDGAGAFHSETRFAAGEEPELMAHADLDTDGVPDLIVANSMSDDVSVLLGRADGSFETQHRFRVRDEPRSVVISDIDENGSPDIVVAEFGSRTLSLLLNRCDANVACGPADFANPLGLLDFTDVSAFLGAFAVRDPSSDLAEPFAQWDLADVQAFLSAFGAGCP